MTFKYLGLGDVIDPDKLDVASLMIDLVDLQRQTLNELRLIRAVHFNLPSPGAVVEHHDKDGGK